MDLRENETAFNLLPEQVSRAIRPPGIGAGMLMSVGAAAVHFGDGFGWAALVLWAEEHAAEASGGGIDDAPVAIVHPDVVIGDQRVLHWPPKLKLLHGTDRAPQEPGAGRDRREIYCAADI